MKLRNTPHRSWPLGPRETAYLAAWSSVLGVSIGLIIIAWWPNWIAMLADIGVTAVLGVLIGWNYERVKAAVRRRWFTRSQ